MYYYSVVETSFQYYSSIVFYSHSVYLLQEWQNDNDNSPCTLFLQFTHSTALHLEFGQIRRFSSTEEESHTDACFYCVSNTHKTLYERWPYLCIGVPDL